MTEDEMVGWHCRLDGHEPEQALGVGDGQGSLACAVHGAAKSQTRLSDRTATNGLRRGKGRCLTAAPSGRLGSECRSVSKAQALSTAKVKVKGKIKPFPCLLFMIRNFFSLHLDNIRD